MPLVESRVVIEDASLGSVWDVMRDFEAFPRLMPDVVDVKCFDRAGDTLKWIPLSFAEPRKPHATAASATEDAENDEDVEPEARGRSICQRYELAPERTTAHRPAIAAPGSTRRRCI